MKKFLPVCLIMFAAASCKQAKEYKYVETVYETSLFSSSRTLEDEKPKIIKAYSDSAAYVEAFKDFCISQKVAKDMKEAFGSVSSDPVSFKLFDDQGNDITLSVSFASKNEREKEIATRVFSMRNTIKESGERAKAEDEKMVQANAPVDSATIKSLLRYFKITKDEFDKDGREWYKPKSAPKYTNANGIYCYFDVVNGVADNFRFRIQYFNDDWLFIQRYQFSIDGKAYEYIPSDVETDSGGGGYIWEWFDESVLTLDDVALIKALADAKTAKVKFIGRQYYDIKTITKDQVLNIKRSVDLYTALGGKL